jgi:hypothetical protein
MNAEIRFHENNRRPGTDPADGSRCIHYLRSYTWVSMDRCCLGPDQNRVVIDDHAPSMLPASAIATSHMRAKRPFRAQHHRGTSSVTSYKGRLRGLGLQLLRPAVSSGRIGPGPGWPAKHAAGVEAVHESWPAAVTAHSQAQVSRPLQLESALRIVRAKQTGQIPGHEGHLALHFGKLDFTVIASTKPASS